MRYCVNCLAYVEDNPCPDCGRRTLPVMEDTRGRAIAPEPEALPVRAAGPWDGNRRES